MFLDHFGMTMQPFAERMAAEGLWPDDRLRQGLARLQYLADGGGAVGLITGGSGVGKSALLKRFLHETCGPRLTPIYLHLTHLSTTGLFKLLVAKLEEVPFGRKDRLFHQILAKAAQLDGTLMLILDEAHLLAADALVDLRLLVSGALDEAPPLKLVLVGQEPLGHTLRQARHADLANRIAVRHHLSPLGRDETAAYIDFQVQRVGGSPKLFDASAKRLIHDYTGGVPRQINNLATACLLCAATGESARITEAILQQTFAEFQLP